MAGSHLAKSMDVSCGKTSAAPGVAKCTGKFLRGRTPSYHLIILPPSYRHLTTILPSLSPSHVKPLPSGASPFGSLLFPWVYILPLDRRVPISSLTEVNDLGGRLLPPLMTRGDRAPKQQLVSLAVARKQPRSFFVLFHPGPRV